MKNFYLIILLILITLSIPLLAQETISQRKIITYEKYLEGKRLLEHYLDRPDLIENFDDNLKQKFQKLKIEISEYENSDIGQEEIKNAKIKPIIDSINETKKKEEKEYKRLAKIKKIRENWIGEDYDTFIKHNSPEEIIQGDKTFVAVVIEYNFNIRFIFNKKSNKCIDIIFRKFDY